MKEQDQTIRSIPDGKRRINEAYRLFEKFIQQVKTLESRRLQGKTIASLASNPVEDDFEDQKKRSKQIRDNARVNFEAAFKRLRELHGRLPEAFVPILPMLRHSLRPLGTFHFEGAEEDHAFAFIDVLFYRAESWALTVESLLSSDLEVPIDPRTRDCISEIEDALPLSPESEKALGDRLALEESQLQRDLPKFALIAGVKERKPETVFEIVQEVETAYDFAYSLVTRLRLAGCFATQAAELTVVGFFPGEDEAERIEEDIAQAKGKLFDRRWELIDLCSLIDSDLEELREAFLGVPVKVFEHSYADTKDFEETGDPSVYGALTKINGGLCYEVKRWISETLGFLSLAERLPVAVDLTLQAKCNELADGFPMNHNFERAIRKRILFEKSVLTRNAKAFAESRGIGGSATTTTPGGRRKREETDSQKEEARLYKLWKVYSSKKGLPRNKTKAFLEAHKDIGNVYDEEAFRALVDRNRSR